MKKGTLHQGDVIASPSGCLYMVTYAFEGEECAFGLVIIGHEDGTPHEEVGHHYMDGVGNRWTYHAENRAEGLPLKKIPGPAEGSRYYGTITGAVNGSDS